VGGDDTGGPDTGDSTPPGSDSPGGGSPGGGGAPGGSGDSGDSSPTGGGGDDDERQVYNNSIDDLMNILDRSTIGHDYYTYLQDNNIDVIFTNLGEDVGGLFVPDWWFDVYPVTGGGLTGYDPHTIYIDDDFMTDYSPEAGAAVLMHEATHAFWDGHTDELADYEVDYYNNTFVNDYPAAELAAAGYPASIAEADVYWTRYREGPQAGNQYFDADGDPRISDTVIQENSCFNSQVDLWNELKGRDPSISDDWMDSLSGYKSSGNLFGEVWLLYANYRVY